MLVVNGALCSRSFGDCIGLVNFDNLEINETAFDHLQLPFAIRHGSYQVSFVL